MAEEEEVEEEWVCFGDHFSRVGQLERGGSRRGSEGWRVTWVRVRVRMRWDLLPIYLTWCEWMLVRRRRRRRRRRSVPGVRV